MVYKDLRKFISKRKTMPLDDNYLKALKDVEDYIGILENKYKNEGNMSIRIDKVGEFGCSECSGTIHDGLQFLINYIFSSATVTYRSCDKFLVEVRSIEKYDDLRR